MADSLRDDLSAAFDTFDGSGTHDYSTDPLTSEAESAVADLGAALDSAGPDRDVSDARPRDEHGRFVAKNADAPEAASPPEPAAPPAGAEAAPEAPAPVEQKRPSSWKKEMWEHFDKLDPTVKDYVLKREQDFAAGVSAYKAEAERARAIFDTLGPYQQMFAQMGARPEQAVDALLRTHTVLSYAAPEQKLQKFMELAQFYGVPLQALGQQPAQDGQQQQPGAAAVDPRLDHLTRQVQALTGQIQQYQTAQQQMELEKYKQEVQAFRSDPQHPHFDQVRETMIRLLEAGVVTTFAEAYEQAVWSNPEIRQQVIAQQQREASAERQRQAQTVAARAKASAVSPRSASPTGTTARADSKGDLRSDLASAFDAAVAGAGRV